MATGHEVVSAASNIQSVEFHVLSVAVDGLNTALKVNLPVLASLAIAVILLGMILKYIIGGFKGFGAEEALLIKSARGLIIPFLSKSKYLCFFQ
ncbi:hypothetical protein, partial [Moritella sp.]|uniref:hypothetical protein n=1 Tax=Moritella sp. TaxID=78556 RepID=UPI0025FD4812